MNRFCFGLAITLAALNTGEAFSQGYPNRSVRVLVPFAAGGAVDVLARLIGQKLSEGLGQPVIIENRPGAGGNLASDVLAKSPPDGYTVLQTVNGISISPSLYKTLPFDSQKDFIAVTQIVQSQLILVANPNLPANNVAEFVALAKSKPGTLNYGSTGVGNPLHLTMEMLKSATGIDIQAVPYRGDAPANAALIAGEIQLGVMPMATTLPLIEAGRLKALAIGGAKRSAAMPNVPTVAETIQGFEFDELAGLLHAGRHAARACRATAAGGGQGTEAARRSGAVARRWKRRNWVNAGGIRRAVPSGHYEVCQDYRRRENTKAGLMQRPRITPQIVDRVHLEVEIMVMQ